MIKMYFKPRLKRPPPIIAKRFYFKKRRNTLAFRICAVGLVFVVLCVLLDMRLRPIIETVGGNALKNSLSNVVDGAVNEIVDELGVKYGEMVNIEKNGDGTIAALTLNNTAINGYKAELADACSDKLSNFDKTVVPVPLGSLLGGSFLNGRGFNINTRATIYGFAVTDVVSKFESAGINQTRHIIYLEVKASAYAYMGLCKLEESVDETIILVETIIVGKVPSTYYIGNENINYPYIPE
ncbi:MAG: sporulation protein YunB [Clostridia bacterium]|nr:sporulation protein YunB [Clostridia bacterium]